MQQELEGYYGADSTRNQSSKTLAGPFPPFHTDDANEYPHNLFLEWFHEAMESGVHEPHSMTLSTVKASSTNPGFNLSLMDFV